MLWGCAGHAKVLAGLIAGRGGRVVALFDNRDVPSVLPDVPVFFGEAGFLRWADTEPDITAVAGLVAVGGQRGRERLALQALFRGRGLQVPVLIHPDASICLSAQLGAGSQVLAQAVLAADVRLGEACIVNHKASADHECVLGDGVHLAPGVTLCGCIKVGDNAFIGAGSVVLPRLTIGADAVVGAGAVVTRDVPEGVTVAGCPARRIS